MTKERACASKFGLSGENPVDRLMSAIAILQAYYLAQDTNLSAEYVFGSMHMKTEGIEHVIRILIEVLEFVDDAVGDDA